MVLENLLPAGNGAKQVRRTCERAGERNPELRMAASQRSAAVNRLLRGLSAARKAVKAG